MKSILALAFAALVSAQTVPITVSVNWPNRDIVKAKYGSLPKSIYPGEVTGCNTSTDNVFFSQGTVIQALKAQNLEAYSRTDAIAVIGAAQRGQFRSRWLKWSPVAQASLRAVNGFVITRVITVTPVVGTLLTAATAISDGVLPIINAGVAQDPNLTYEADGMPAIAQLPPGSCVVGTVMFATPGGVPTGGSKEPQFTVQVPVK